MRLEYKQLYDYQKTCVKKMKESKCVWLEPGCGKTVTSIWAYKLYGQGRLLIIAPAPMIKEWEDECLAYGITNVDILSYNKICMTQYQNKILANKYDVAIIDEHQKTNNPQNKSTKFLLKILDSIRLKYLLSATPSGNYAWKDLYIAFRIIKGRSYMTYSNYRKRYFIETPSFWNRYVYDIIGYKNTDELIALSASISMSIKPEHNIKRVEYIKTVPIDPEVSAKFRKILRQKVYKDYVFDSTAKVGYAKRMFSSGMLLNNDEDSYSYEIVSTEKIKVLDELLKKLNNVVIFYNYKNELDLIIKSLPQYKFNIYEDTKTLNSLPMGKYNLVSYASGSEGINTFRDSNTYIAFSMPYSCIKFTQSKGRLNRVKAFNVEYFYYIMSPYDLEVYTTLKSGKSFSDKLMASARI